MNFAIRLVSDAIGSLPRCRELQDRGAHFKRP
jgi:hypothetical protein